MTVEIKERKSPMHTKRKREEMKVVKVILHKLNGDTGTKFEEDNEEVTSKEKY